jgi:hypothetical protein
MLISALLGAGVVRLILLALTWRRLPLLGVPDTAYYLIAFFSAGLFQALHGGFEVRIVLATGVLADIFLVGRLILDVLLDLCKTHLLRDSARRRR